MIGWGIPEYEAKRYEGFVKEGGILVSVHVDNADEIASVKRTFHATGATDVAATGEVGNVETERSEPVLRPGFKSEGTLGKVESERDIRNVI